MTWTRNITIMCDEDGCTKMRSTGQKYVEKAEEMALGEGWTKESANEHYCPTHS